MKKLLVICAAAVMACCCTSSKNGGATVFQGKFIGFNGEFVEFFLPQGDDYLEIPVNVKEDGTFCDTLQFPENLYDAALFADKFMFRVSVEQGKAYTAEFDITEEGVETNFRFLGEGEPENRFMAHLWSLDALEAVKGATTFKEFSSNLKAAYAPLREELKGISNKHFVKFHTDEMDSKEEMISYYYPFFARAAEDADFAAFVAKRKKLSDEAFSAIMAPVCTNVPYVVKGLTVTEALKAAASLSVNPFQKEWAMATMLAQMVGSGNVNGLEEGYEYFCDNVENEDFLDQADELCGNAMMLTPGLEAPEIEFEDVNGKIHHLSDFRGKPVYVDLWASWCGPCCEEIPHLARFVESLGKKPEIVCISVSIDEERSEWIKKLDEVGSAWPQYLATEAGQDAISNQYFVSGIPRFLLIDADGKIASVNAPRPSNPNLLEELKELL